MHDASAFTVALIGNIAVFGGNLFGIAMARRCDRIGYLKFFRQGSLALVVLTLLFGFFPGSMAATVLFLLFIYNGASGLLAGPLLMMRGAAAAKLAPDEGGEPYVAAYSLILRLFSFAGSLAASRLFLFCQNWAGGGIPEAFAAYFKAAGIIGIILFLPLYNRGSALLDKKQPSTNT
ncbi:MAG: hypothetical protein IJU70_11055 [Lentisphaeria bacterium]|nr:hypothetical protein [Lentisphaeria bacterium]